MRTSLKVVGRYIRPLRVRGKVQGTAERPRQGVYRSNRWIFGQLVEDDGA